MFLITACSQKKAEQAVANSSNESSIVFKLDDNSSNFIWNYRYFKGELVNYNHTTHSFDFFNEKGLSKRIYLEKDGPNRIPSVWGFFIDQDVIFISGQVGELILIDLTGNVRRRYRDLKNSSNILITPHFLAYHQPLISKGKFYFEALPFQKLNAILYSQAPLMYSLDMKTGEVQEIMNYPKIGSDKVISLQYNISNSTIQLDNTTILNFSHHPDIFSYSKGQWIQHRINSSYFKPISAFKGSVDDELDAREHLFDNGIYKALIYDPFRKLYYRIYTLPRYPGEVDFRRDPYLMVVDEKFNLIEEFPFPQGLSIQGHFVHQDGLYVYNATHAENHEDEIKFDRVYPR
ncbi:MAG: DUF4221 family protein [Mongoliitalea sp.]